MEKYYELDVAKLSEIIGVTGNITVSDEFLIANVTGARAKEFLGHPMRLKAYEALYCIHGEFDVEINIKRYHIEDDTIVFFLPESTIQIELSGSPEENENMEIVILAASKEFIQEVPIQFNGLFEKSIRLLSNPYIRIDDTGKKILKDYHTLVSDLYEMNLVGTGDAIRSIGTSILCLLGNLWADKLSGPAAENQAAMKARAVFERVLILAAENFMTEKKIGFYADKLCFSPKYLTTLIKNVSGRTATDWIDAFLIFEAKNLLKYSDLTVKEIGFKLGFQSIPSFHKFFKNKTGETPSDYRKTS